MISVIIPVYKNREMVIRNLKNNLKFFKDCEVIIINDDPAESLKKDLKVFKEIILIENKKNLGFGQTANRGIEDAKHKYVLLLNSDVLLLDNSFKKSLKHFKNNSKLFAVSFAQKEENSQLVGKNSIYWEGGFFNHKKANDFKMGINGWAEGGSSVFDREKFLKLGGFDPLYSPFYWEDIDLSYRAWKLGYAVIFDPQIKVIHHHESTIGKYFDRSYVTGIAFRNQLIFIWKNITDLKLLGDHLLHLIPKITLTATWKALLLLPTILKNKKVQKKYFIIGDRKVLEFFNE